MNELSENQMTGLGEDEVGIMFWDDPNAPDTPAPAAEETKPAPEPAPEPAPVAPVPPSTPETPAEAPAAEPTTEAPAEAPAVEPAPAAPAEEPAAEPAPEAPAEEPAPEAPAEEPAPVVVPIASEPEFICVEEPKPEPEVVYVPAEQPEPVYVHEEPKEPEVVYVPAEQPEPVYIHEEPKEPEVVYVPAEQPEPVYIHEEPKEPEVVYVPAEQPEPVYIHEEPKEPEIIYVPAEQPEPIYIHEEPKEPEIIYVPAEQPEPEVVYVAEPAPTVTPQKRVGDVARRPYDVTPGGDRTVEKVFVYGDRLKPAAPATDNASFGKLYSRTLRRVADLKKQRAAAEKTASRAKSSDRGPALVAVINLDADILAALFPLLSAASAPAAKKRARGLEKLGRAEVRHYNELAVCLNEIDTEYHPYLPESSVAAALAGDAVTCPEHTVFGVRCRRDVVAPGTTGESGAIASGHSDEWNVLLAKRRTMEKGLRSEKERERVSALIGVLNLERAILAIAFDMLHEAQDNPRVRPSIESVTRTEIRYYNDRILELNALTGERHSQIETTVAEAGARGSVALTVPTFVEESADEHAEMAATPSVLTKKQLAAYLAAETATAETLRAERHALRKKTRRDKGEDRIAALTRIANLTGSVTGLLFPALAYASENSYKKYKSVHKLARECQAEVAEYNDAVTALSRLDGAKHPTIPRNTVSRILSGKRFTPAPVVTYVPPIPVVPVVEIPAEEVPAEEVATLVYDTAAYDQALAYNMALAAMPPVAQKPAEPEEIPDLLLDPMEDQIAPDPIYVSAAPIPDDRARLDALLVGMTSRDLARFIKQKKKAIKERVRLRDRDRSAIGGKKGESRIYALTAVIETERLILEDYLEILHAAHLTHADKVTKKNLAEANGEIRLYNRLIDDINRFTSEKVPHADAKMATNVASGKPYLPIVPIQYRTPDPMLKNYGNAVANGALAKERSETDTAAIDARFAFRIIQAKLGCDTAKANFSRRTTRTQLRAEKDHLAKLSALRRKAMDAERKDNARYEAILSDDPINGRMKRRGADRGKLVELRAKLEALLVERDSMNVDLISLYTGTAEKAGSDADAEFARRFARAKERAFKRQFRIARKINSLYVSQMKKETLFTLLDSRSEEAAVVDTTADRIRLYRLVGKAKRAALADRRRAKRKIRLLDAKIRAFYQKAENASDGAISPRSRIMLLIGVIAFAVIVFVVWHYAGDQIVAALRTRFGF